MVATDTSHSESSPRFRANAVTTGFNRSSPHRDSSGAARAASSARSAAISPDIESDPANASRITTPIRSTSDPYARAKSVIASRKRPWNASTASSDAAPSAGKPSTPTAAGNSENSRSMGSRAFNSR